MKDLNDNNKRTLSFTYPLIFFLLYIVFVFLVFISGCTTAINVVQTQGKATDVVDETATVDPSTTLKL